MLITSIGKGLPIKYNKYMSKNKKREFTEGYAGAIIDDRPIDQREKDYKFEEIVVTANSVNWVEKPQSEWRKFPIYDQDGSNSCVAQTLAKILGIMYWLKNQCYVHFSATHIYQRRANRPGPGMLGVNAFEIARDGVTLEELVPSQKMNDSQMDGVVIPKYKIDVGSIFKIPKYIQPPIGDIETIASIIQTTGKGVMVWFYFQSDEWIDTPEVKNPTLNLYSANTIKHSITAVDYGLVNGKKSIISDESWGNKYGINGQRVITEDFFKKRNWFAAYPMNFCFEEEKEKPKYIFENDLQFGMQGLKDIVALQDCLKYENLFPTNVESTGTFGAITKVAVEKFQEKYDIAHAGEPGYGRVGPKSREKLNQIYG